MEWHVTIAAEDRRALCTSDVARTAAARAIARAGKHEVPLFCVADDHLHLVVRGERVRAGRVAGNVGLAVRRVVEAPLEPARIRPVSSRQHLQSLVPYILDQSSHHELATAIHPALWPGSCFADLVGARRLPGFHPDLLRELLPRSSEERVFAAVGLQPVEPATDEALGQLGIVGLCAAAAAAAGLPHLRGRHEATVAARVLVANLARRLGVPPREVRAALGTPARTARWSAARPHAPEAELALRRWVALRLAAGA